MVLIDVIGWSVIAIIIWSIIEVAIMRHFSMVGRINSFRAQHIIVCGVTFMVFVFNCLSLLSTEVNVYTQYPIGVITCMALLRHLTLKLCRNRIAHYNLK